MLENENPQEHAEESKEDVKPTLESKAREFVTKKEYTLH